MIKWGDFREVDIDLLQQTAVILQKQISAHGSVESAQAAYNPGSIIANQGVVKAFQAMESGVKQTVAIGSVAINHWLLGYIYRLLEDGRYDELMARFDAALDDKGGAHDDDGTHS